MKISQCRMARAGLGWSARDLAGAAGVGYATVARFESGKPITPGSMKALQETLEAAGVQFVEIGKWQGAVRAPD